MNLYNSISRRKSCRKYDMTQLGDNLIKEMENAIKEFMQLYSDVPLEYRITKNIKGRFTVDAPHYMVVSGQGNPNEMESAGFLFEQLVLWFDAKEIGCVWLGSSTDSETDDTSKDLIVIAFGNVTESVHRPKEEFKRKPINTITNAPDDICIQAVHLAPSGMNTQPWYFEKQEGKVFVYQKKLNPPISLLYKISDIDMGIGLCHYALACKEYKIPFIFHRDSKLPKKSGYYSFGIIE